MKKAIVFLIVLTCYSFVKATEQFPDYLYYNNQKLTLHTGWAYPSPLQTYFTQNKMDYPFPVLSTANYRGHIASWEIVDDKLYLKEIKVRDSIFVPEKFNIKSKNETMNRGSAVFADWFSGMISCQENKISYFFYVRYGEVKDIQTITEKDFKKIKKISEKDTSNHVLVNKLYALILNENYISFYFRLGIEKDEILINGQNGRFSDKNGYSPILDFYSYDPMKFPYNWENLDKSGAPNCTWNVVDKKIFLDKVRLYSGASFFEINKDSVDLKSLFEDKVLDGKVFADWLNGVYKIEYGKEKGDGVFPAITEFTPTEFVFLRIKDGIIEELYTVPIDFNFRNIPEDTDPRLKKILEEFK